MNPLAAKRAAFVAEAAQEAGRLWDYYLQEVARCESPIEQLFLGEAFVRGWHAPHLKETFWDEGLALFSRMPGLDKSGARGVIVTDGCAYMISQLPLLLAGRAMRLDFAFGYPGSKSPLAVEIDGHDYHERTKEQARRDKSRDRLLTRHGWRVLRFTGSEVFADVATCWAEVDELLLTMATAKEAAK